MTNSKLLAYARLVRVPNTFTVVADVLAGYTLAAGAWDRPLPLALAIASVVALYWAGMVWNDVADVEQDRRERPGRPIPSGQVLLRTAQAVAAVLTILGIAAAFAANWVTGLVACGTAACILLYDLAAKRTVAAPWLMGGCRAGSLLLGAAAGGLALGPTLLPVESIIWAAAGQAVYVAGFTLAGRREAGPPSKRDLVVGWAICAAGVAVLASLDWSARHFAQEPMRVRLQSPLAYAALVAVLSLPLARRAAVSIRTLRGLDIGGAIRQAIFTIIFFDAAIAAQYGDPLQAVVVCLLIVPTLVLSRWFYAT